MYLYIDDFQGQKTAVEQLKERFEKMNLKYDAYNSIEYVGIQTSGGKQTDFNVLKVAITSILENNKIRSPRRLSVIFKALKVFIYICIGREEYVFCIVI